MLYLNISFYPFDGLLFLSTIYDRNHYVLVVEIIVYLVYVIIFDLIREISVADVFFVSYKTQINDSVVTRRYPIT